MAVTIARASDLAAVGANGGAWTVDMNVSPPGAPTDITTTPAAPWVPVGAVEQKTGITRNFSEKTSDIYAMGLQTPYLTLVNQDQGGFSLALLETYRDIVKSVVFKKPLSEVKADATGKWSFSESGEGIVDRRSWLLAVINGGAMEWFYCPIASLTLSKDQVFTDNDVASIIVDIAPYPDATGQTIYHIGQLPAGVSAS